MTDSSAIDAKNINDSVEPQSGVEDDYERAMQRAFARMEKGFHMGEIPKLDREALHDRAAMRQTESH
jgi:hypothetical protein